MKEVDGRTCGTEEVDDNFGGVERSAAVLNLEKRLMAVLVRPRRSAAVLPLEQMRSVLRLEQRRLMAVLAWPRRSAAVLRLEQMRSVLRLEQRRLMAVLVRPRRLMAVLVRPRRLMAVLVRPRRSAAALELPAQSFLMEQINGFGVGVLCVVESTTVSRCVPAPAELVLGSLHVIHVHLAIEGLVCQV
ncbi:hypothetical protein J6590_098141 [Homalodisca vitripennis]|nr:hypothetical protein J6590_098141 [Homalodisca vitripennis]